MIRELQGSAGSTIGVEITEKVSLDEEKKWTETLDMAIEEHGKISVLIVMGEEAKWGVKAGVEDVKWILKNMKKLKKLAIVSEKTTWKWLVALDSPFAKLVGISEKHFEPSELTDAWEWIKS